MIGSMCTHRDVFSRGVLISRFLYRKPKTVFLSFEYELLMLFAMDFIYITLTDVRRWFGVHTVLFW